MKIYVLTADKSVHIVEGLQYCINKYWKHNPNVVLLGYQKPAFELVDNFEFQSLGKDRGPGTIGEDLINYFNNIKDKHFIFTVDDFFPIREVNTDLLDTLIEKMVSNNISRVALTDQVSSKPHSIIEDKEDYKIRKWWE